MQQPQNKIERSIIKIVTWTLGVIIFLIAGGVVGYKQFHKWQERRLVAQANALVNEGDLKRAGLDARRILQINPESAAGCRIMARISEQAASKVAVEWRRRVVDLEPGSTSDWIALARTAVRFNDNASRDFALSKIPETAKSTTEYHALAADLAARKNDGAELERHLQEAVRLDPANLENRLRLATVQLGGTDAAVRKQARATLVELQSEAAFRRPATRRLAEDALRRGEFNEAAVLGRQLDGFPEKTFDDRLLLLTALHRTADPGCYASAAGIADCCRGRAGARGRVDLMVECAPDADGGNLLGIAIAAGNRCAEIGADRAGRLVCRGAGLGGDAARRKSRQLGWA